MKLWNLHTGMWFRLGEHKLQFVKPDGLFAICRDALGIEHHIRITAEVEVDK